MKRRKWDPKTKAMVVLQGLKGRPVAEICNEHQICQSEYYATFAAMNHWCHT